MARLLGPVNFGILSVALVSLSLISDIATVGTDTGIVKFVSQHFISDRQKALKFLKLGFEIKLGLGLAILLIGFFVSPIIAKSVFNKPELITPFRYAIFGSFGMLLFSFTTSALQAVQKFWAWGIVNILANLVRLISVVLLIYSKSLNLDTSLTVYIACIFLGFAMAIGLLPNFLKVKGEKSLFREFVGYNKWVAFFVVIAAISGRLDTYISTRMLSLKDVGLYSVALSLSAVGSQIVTGITTVVAPKLASFDTAKKAKDYLLKLQLFVSILAVLVIVLGIPLGYLLIPILYGHAYLPSLTPLAILIVAQAIFLLSIPAHSSVFYYFSYPKLFVYTSLVNLLIILIIGWLLIGRFGYIGAASTVLIGNVANLAIPGVWAIRKFSKV